MKNLNKKHFYVFILIVFFIFSKRVFAGVIFNEIQISPTEGRFIELYNSGSSSIDLTGYYIQRKTATGGEFSSLISKTLFEGKSIEAGGYFLISKSLNGANIVPESLTITESNTLQLKNSNQDVVDKIGFGDSPECNTVCNSNPPSGQSLQKTSSGWIIGSPTPGESNSNTSTNDTNDEVSTTNSDSGNESSLSSSSSSRNEEESKVYPITTKIIAPKIVVANIPFTIDHKTTGIHKEKVILGKFVWNFGDGMKKEVAVSDPFTYAYYYPGDYVLSLSFYDSLLDTVPDSTDRISIKVIPSGVSISSVGSYDDPFIEIYNNSNYEMSLRDWVIKGVNKQFIIPEGMVVLPGKKIKLSPKITGFEYNDLGYISIIDSSGQVFVTYPKYTNHQSSSTSYKVFSDKISNKVEPKEKEIVDLNNLEANAINSSTKDLNLNSIYPWAFLVLIIIIGSVSVITIKKKDHYEDYVEKEISAKDMNIIE